MRHKQQLADLSESGKTVFLPTYNYGFEKFKSKLFDLLEDNFGRDIAKSLEYNEHDQTFSVLVSVWYWLPKRDAQPVIRMELASPVGIDPRVPLLPQFQIIESTLRRLSDEEIKITVNYSKGNQ